MKDGKDGFMGMVEDAKALDNRVKAVVENMVLQQTVAMEREAILDAARECVCRNREADYGSPEDSFGMIARLWTAYMGIEFEPKDVAAMMILLKTARIAGGSRNLDNWIDIAGYAACGGEIMGRRKE